jgi:4-oxalocrotonate tautomerase
MPLVRIDISKEASAERVRVVGQAVYRAMTTVANVPLHDKFQVITRHGADELIYPAEGYLGATYSPDIIFIQVVWVGGRSIEAKQAFYKQIADEIHEKERVRKEDIFITLIDNAREDWSFGSGLIQYAPQ